jgi:hypothetical protein
MPMRRGMAVLQPLRVIISNYPVIRSVSEAANHPQDESMGVNPSVRTRVYIDRVISGRPQQVQAPGSREVKSVCAMPTSSAVTGRQGCHAVIELHCSYVPATLGGKPGRAQD